jgi:NADH-quinone oxidoreductase subunit L
MYLLILFLPLFSFTVASFFGRFFGPKPTALFSTSCIFVTALLSTLAFYEVGLESCNCYIQVTTWIDSAMLHAS